MAKKVYPVKSQRNPGAAWVISVNMGYGHQRTAYPLKDLAFQEQIINANDYKGINIQDKKIWNRTRLFYEFISNFKRLPLAGDFIFSIFDAFQKILGFYPKRDLSRPNFAIRQIYSLLEKGWGRDLILQLNPGQAKKPLPLITTFFTPAFIADHFHYPGKIFCIVCDADISRTWASLNPATSKIKYLVPTERAAERLKLYGVKPQNIFLTGYPLPKELIGTKRMEILKKDLKTRIVNLDPQKKYYEKYKALIKKHLGILPKQTSRPLTLLFSVGGAGAQREIAVKILESLSSKIKQGRVKMILSAGIREKTKDYFLENIEKLNFKNVFSKGIEIIFEKDIESYFNSFNRALRKTDILWTKPSELSFYSTLGIPIIIAPSIGSQEEFNKRWLIKSGFGLLQENPEYTDQWLFDWLNQGYLAEAAFQGFIEGEKLGTFKIGEIISK